jgi:alginate O-acetyltransferase complex protein AlgI
MIFTSFEFLIFFLVVLVGHNLLRSRAADNWFLLFASYVFYMSWNIACGVLIMAISLVDFVVGRQLAQTTAPTVRKWWVMLSIGVNLGLLGFFKYANFLTANVGWGFQLVGIDTSRWHLDIVLPVGISFFTFQSMSYTLDVFRGRIQPCNSLRDYLLYVAFFPQLVAGPIVRAADLLPQLGKKAWASVRDVEVGLAQFGIGAVKKLVISDQVASNVDLVFANPGQFAAPTLLLGVLGYAVQIYCDFSGYSDMAIGAARMMGFRFAENFQMPYSATNITEFWRRWHISLSSWFRDYVYIPLGGSRRGVHRTYLNLLLTMLLCGLWHGASWNFVLWGLVHGLGLAGHRLWTTWRRRADRRITGNVGFLGELFSRCLTLGLVLVGWILFRAQSLDSAMVYLARLVVWETSGTRVLLPYVAVALAFVAIAHLSVQKDRNWAAELIDRPIPVRVLAFTGMLLLLVCFGASDAAPFIYFQF